MYAATSSLLNNTKYDSNTYCTIEHIKVKKLAHNIYFVVFVVQYIYILASFYILYSRIDTI